MQKTQQTIRRYDLRQEENGPKDAPANRDIPVPPTEDVPAPIKEPFEEDKPNEPIIDEEKKAPRLIV
jgi:hypothetical protein